MKILIKIEKLNKEKNKISAKFCNLKSEKSIDTYRKHMVNCEELDNSNIINFCEDLGKLGSRYIESYEKNLPTLPENNPVELNDDMLIDDIVGKTICVNYPPREYKKLKVRRVEL